MNREREKDTFKNGGEVKRLNSCALASTTYSEEILNGMPSVFISLIIKISCLFFELIKMY